MKLCIGTSGFSYEHWRGVLYPEKLSQNKWLPFYAQSFNTVEINMTFYRTPRETVLSGWKDKTPDGFAFTLKAPRLITHVKRLRESDDSLKKFYSLFRLLGEKGACILFQMPPSFHLTDENLRRLEQFVQKLEEGIDHAFEFRHPAWWSDECYSLLKGKAIFCSVNGLDMPSDIVITDRAAYIRFHGERYDTSYDGRFLKKFAETLAGKIRSARTERVYIYFNNDAHGYAPQNALALKHLMDTETGRPL